MIAAMLRTVMALLFCLLVIGLLAAAGIHGLRSQDAYRCAHRLAGTSECATR